MDRKLRSTVLLAFVVSVMLMPTMLFAQGDIIGYAGGWQAPPTAAQLDRVTHVMLMEWRPNADGTLNNLYPGQLGNWLTAFVNTAHAKGVKVSMAISGSSTSNFSKVTEDANRGTFVTNIVNFVNANNLDGVDIDWEFPKGNDQWSQCMSLLEELKAEMPNKRISMAIGGDSPGYPGSPYPGGQYANHFNCPDRTIVQKRIWNALDAIHLMTYGMQGVTKPVRWETHADVNASKACIDRWAEFGAGQPGFGKEKLVMGCAFYGIATPTTDGFYKNGGGVGCDTPATLKQKVDHCYDNEYGGVMIWELGYDKNLSTTPDLLSAIWDATQAKIEYSDIYEQSFIAATQIYPNPATTELYVKRVSRETADYIIYSTAGQIVLQGKLQGDAPISVYTLPNGIYYLRISGETLKVIIAK